MTRQPSFAADEFNVPCQALHNTEWVTNPADPTNQDKGMVRQGETIWFLQDHTNTGLIWQQARLADETLRYVQHRDFTPPAVGEG